MCPPAQITLNPIRNGFSTLTGATAHITVQMDSMPNLTQKQQAVLDFISAAAEVGTAPPTLREIAAHFGFRSKTAAADHVRALRQKGFLKRDPDRKARALQLSGPGRRRPKVDIPIFGTIPAGFPRTDIKTPRDASRLTWGRWGSNPPHAPSPWKCAGIP